MVFLAGIDEAGYGPLLGPFVVGYSLFRVPQADADLWQCLHEVATRAPHRKDRRLRVDDSKRVHSGPQGRPRLERSVAAFRAAAEPAGDLASWISAPPAGPTRWLDRAPWFRDLGGPLCPGADPDHARLDAARLRRELHANGCQVEGFGARPVPAAEWNRLNAELGSKGDALFAVTVEVLRHVLRQTADSPLRVEIDRHGARLRYAARLSDALQPRRVETHGETRGGSAYTLHFENRAVEVRFSESADCTHFPVSLASLAAKLTRERMMDLWNRWFLERIPGVRPTKGYAKDARRWLDEAAPRLAGLEIPTRTLVRDR